jgi:hypothetical protein
MTMWGTHSYSGGTDIVAGTWKPGAQTETLPNSGTVTVYGGATLDTQGRDDTIGGLAGTGNVQLQYQFSRYCALTVTEGIMPGMSVGTLTIDGTSPNNSLTLGAGANSVFELGPLAGPNDKVAFSGLTTLTLGGELTVADAGGLETGTYTLFDGVGGSISGSFTATNMPNRVLGVVRIAGGDVLLDVTVLPPRGTVITVQ